MYQKYKLKYNNDTFKRESIKHLYKRRSVSRLQNNRRRCKRRCEKKSKQCCTGSIARKERNYKQRRNLYKENTEIKKPAQGKMAAYLEYRNTRTTESYNRYKQNSNEVEAKIETTRQ